MKTRQTKIELLKRHPKNYREHPAEQLSQIKASLAEHGCYRNIVCARDGTILAGHGVVEAARELGLKTLPVAHLDLEPDDMRALKLLVADNELRRQAMNDEETLAQIIAELEASAISFEGLGFTDEDLDKLLAASVSGDEVDPTEEWKAAGMPEFEPYRSPAVRSVTLHFQCEVDFESFLTLVRPELSYELSGKKIRTIWFPSKPPIRQKPAGEFPGTPST